MTNYETYSHNLELIQDRLYAEMNQTPTESEEFKAAFRYAAELRQEKSEKDIKLESDVTRLKLDREAAETQKIWAEAKRIEHETNQVEPKQSFFDKHGDAIISATAGALGVILVVSAESIGNKILNSKAMKMPTMKF